MIKSSIDLITVHCVGPDLIHTLGYHLCLQLWFCGTSITRWLLLKD